jgi:hypothetical protein
MSCARRFSPPIIEAFLLALDRIDAVNREPTPLEAAWLFGALGAMASGDEHSAEQKIALCAHANLQQRRAWIAPTALTVAGLRRTLAELSTLEKALNVNSSSRAPMDVPRQANAMATEPPPHADQPTCAWCGRGKLEVINEWRDPTFGVIGVTLKCGAAECGKLVEV